MERKRENVRERREELEELKGRASKRQKLRDRRLEEKTWGTVPLTCDDTLEAVRDWLIKPNEIEAEKKSRQTTIKLLSEGLSPTFFLLISCLSTSAFYLLSP